MGKTVIKWLGGFRLFYPTLQQYGRVSLQYHHIQRESLMMLVHLWMILLCCAKMTTTTTTTATATTTTTINTTNVPILPALVGDIVHDETMMFDAPWQLPYRQTWYYTVIYYTVLLWQRIKQRRLQWSHSIITSSTRKSPHVTILQPYRTKRLHQLITPHAVVNSFFSCLMAGHEFLLSIGTWKCQAKITQHV